MGYAVFHASKGSGAGGKLGAHIDRDESQKQDITLYKVISFF